MVWITQFQNGMLAPGLYACLQGGPRTLTPSDEVLRRSCQGCGSQGKVQNYGKALTCC